jgi:hypothetical protein
VQLPCKQKEDEDVKINAPAGIESRQNVSLQILFLSLTRTCIPPLLNVTMKAGLFLKVCIYNSRSLDFYSLIRRIFFGVRTVDMPALMFSRQI